MAQLLEASDIDASLARLSSCGNHTEKPLVWISVPYGMSARNVLRSDILPRLKDRCRVIVLSPLASDRVFREEFEERDVIVRILPKRFGLSYKICRRFLDYAEAYWFTRQTRIPTLTILEECLQRSQPLRYMARKLLGMSMGTFEFTRKALRKLHNALIPLDYFLELAQDHHPDMIFQTHPLALEEFPLAVFAKKTGVPVVAMIHSWDNVTAKSGMRMVTSDGPGRMLPVKFDKVVVWNAIQRQELCRYYEHSASDIFVGGVPQFDKYVRHKYPQRDHVIRRLGGDPQKRVILYAGGSPALLPRQNEVIEGLVRALSDRRFVLPCQLILRQHPGTGMDQWDKFRGIPDVLFQAASKADTPLKVQSGWVSEGDDGFLLAETLKWSDVVIHVASTMAIDAAILDKPNIAIAFDGHEQAAYHQSIRKHYDFTHYRPVVESGGTCLATSAGDLIEKINVYLTKPSKDQKGRRLIVERLCHQADGMAGDRIGRWLADLAKVSFNAKRCS